MKSTKILWVLTLLFSKIITAQTDHQQIIEKSKQTIDSIINAEKWLLKEEIKKIDALLDLNRISTEVAEQMKKEASVIAQNNIKEKTKPSIEKISQAVFQKSKNDIIANEENLQDHTQHGLESQKLDSLFNSEKEVKNNRFSAVVKQNLGVTKTIKHYSRRVTGGVNFAIAFHNMRSKEHPSNDKFRIWGSKSVEIGYYRNVRIFKDNNLLHLNYGLSWMMNKLKMKGDDYFVNNNGITEIQPYKTSVTKSKFKTHYLILPVNMELDFTPSFTYQDKEYYPIHRHFRVGIGAYMGLLLSNKQKIKYKEADSRHKEVNCGNYNVNEWIYGLSAHLGVRKCVFYARYSLVPLFRNNPIDEYPFSVGVRWGG